MKTQDFLRKKQSSKVEFSTHKTIGITYHHVIRRKNDPYYNYDLETDALMLNATISVIEFFLISILLKIVYEKSVTERSNVQFTASLREES